MTANEKARESAEAAAEALAPDAGILASADAAGLGEAMLAASTRNLRERGFRFISLTVTEANDRAIALYKRIGFEATRVFDAFVWEG